MLAFPVVGIGASAGGLQAVGRLLRELPAHTGMAFVVVLHLPPQQQSHAAEVLQRGVRMPVQQAAAPRTPLQPDHVYVVAPGVQLQLEDGCLLARPLPATQGARVGIDLFFRALADVQRERSMVVLMSGSGSDGAVGLAAVKEVGGLVLVQAPSEAEFDGMPRAALASGQVDFVLPAAELAAKLLSLSCNARRIQLPAARLRDDGGTAGGDGTALALERALQQVMQLLRERTGNDFRHYKRSTVLRRLERRLQVNGLPDLAAYHRHLLQHPAETAGLLRDMLISVTSFFRDAPAFEALEEAVVQQLQASGGNGPYRAWSVGCATGEEAYSLAMLLHERLRAQGDRGLQLFASDIDDEALFTARRGRYREAIVADVPAARLAEHFEHEADAYSLRPALREHITFCHHNVLHDPPFAQLDLVVCRNLLIYLERDVQARVLQVFHFALRPGGLLLLGSAESAEAAPGLFEAVDKRQRLYRATPFAPRVHALSVARASAPPATTLLVEPPRLPTPLERLHQRLLRQHMPESLVVDGQDRVMHLSAGAGHYMQLAIDSSEAMGVHLPTLLRPPLGEALTAALLRARQTRQRVATRAVRFTTAEGEPRTVQMRVLPDSERPGAPGPLLVVFADVELHLGMTPTSTGAPSPLVATEDQMAQLAEQLAGSRDASALSQEALLNTNEELQSMNEELRSATEELEISQENLQSLNEELVTTNQALQAKMQELARANDDLGNLMTSMGIATLFVDRSLRVQRFTPAARRLFQLPPGEDAPSLRYLPHGLQHAGLEDDMAQVLRTAEPLERELPARDDRWYLLRLSPYRTHEDRIDGVVLNFIDVTERRRAQELLRAREERLRLVAESTRDYAIITLDDAGLVTSWDKGAELMFGYPEAEAMGRHIRMLFTPEDQASGQPERELATALHQGRAMDERWHQRKDGSRLYCSGITTPLLDGRRSGFAKIARDLTERQLLDKQRDELLHAEQQVRAQLEAASALRSEFLAVMSHELKNPLNVVLINAELIRRSPQALTHAPLARAAETIRKTVQGQAQIIDDLLDLSRLETGKLSLERTAVAYAPVVDRIAGALRAQAAEKSIRITVHAQDLVVQADLVRLEQIVWNLASNAVKYTQAGGTVTITLVREGALARLDVVDNGPGIAPGFIDSMFNMFEQGDSRASTRREGGLGIGLALVKQLTDLHGGHVEAHSEGPGRGATFTVWLPMCEAAVEHGAEPGTPNGELAGRRVLLVEDNLDTLEVLAELLRLEGAEVATASAAAQALALADAQDFDLVVSDIAMPGMDGHQLMQALRLRERCRDWPAIAVTGFGRRADAERALAAGFQAHIPKPLSLAALLQAARPLLGGRS